MKLSDATTWSYQLQDLDPDEVAASPIRIMVVEHTGGRGPRDAASPFRAARSAALGACLLLG